MGKPAQHHLTDAHGITGMRAHLLANPNDKQAKRSHTGRKTISKPRRIIGATEPDFSLIDEEDHFA